MLRTMLTGLGLSKPTLPVAIHSPFSKAAVRMRQQPSMFVARPLQMATTYSTNATTAQNQFGLFGSDNVRTISAWLSQHYKMMGIDATALTITKIPLQDGDQFVGFNRDKLLNKHVIVYPFDIVRHRIWKMIFKQARSQKKELGVLELTKPLPCFKVTLTNGFWFFLIPHDQLMPRHKVRHPQNLEQNTNSVGIVRKNK